LLVQLFIVFPDDFPDRFVLNRLHNRCLFLILSLLTFFLLLPLSEDISILFFFNFLSLSLSCYSFFSTLLQFLKVIHLFCSLNLFYFLSFDLFLFPSISLRLPLVLKCDLFFQQLLLTFDLVLGKLFLNFAYLLVVFICVLIDALDAVI
jgi:hypothetical protein